MMGMRWKRRPLSQMGAEMFVDRVSSSPASPSSASPSSPASSSSLQLESESGIVVRLSAITEWAAALRFLSWKRLTTRP
jgi:hypothetical protein